MSWEPDIMQPQHRVGAQPGNSLFKELDDTECDAFIRYALDNDVPDYDQWFVYHPLCREIWTLIGKGLKN